MAEEGNYSGKKTRQSGKHFALSTSDASRTTLILRVSNSSQRPLTDVRLKVQLEAPHWTVLDRERRMSCLDCRSSTLLSVKLQRNPGMPVKRASDLTVRIALRVTAEGYPDYDLGARRFQVPVKAFKEVLSDGCIPRRFIIGSPLVPHESSERELFCDRSQILDRIKSSFYGGIQRERIYLDGVRRAGKTSILNFVPEVMPENVFPVMINLDVFAALGPPLNSPAILRSLCIEIGRTAEHRCGVSIHIFDQATWETSPSRAFDGFLSAFSAALPGRVPCLMIDEFQVLLTAIARTGARGKQDTLVLDQLRGHMDEGRIFAIFTGALRFENLSKPVKHRIFGSLTRVRVPFLNEEGVAAVLRAGLAEWVSVPTETICKVHDHTGGFVWLVQRYGAELVDLLNQEQRTVATPDDIEHVALERVLCNDDLFQFWWPPRQLGPAEERFAERLLKDLSRQGSCLVREWFDEIPSRERHSFLRAFENLRACEVLDSTQTEQLRFRGSVLRQWLESKVTDEGHLKIRQ